MSEKRGIAILAAGSHIAKGLIHRFLGEGASHLYLFTRSAGRTAGFLKAIGAAGGDFTLHEGYGDLRSHRYDVLINCVGVGTHKALQGDFTKYFTVIEEFDNLALSYLREVAPGALYVGFSSGAVYGGDFSAPFEEGTENRLRVNGLEMKDCYSIVRLYSEAKHRAFRDFRIVDLRVFSYFSRFLDLSEGYFMAEVLDAVLGGKTLRVGPGDFVRDFVHPEDLFSLVLKCMAAGPVNAALDVVSAKPVGKQEILDYFSSEYGLRYVADPSAGDLSTTGPKQVYYSRNRNAAAVGYRPKYVSMETIALESEPVLRGGGAGAERSA